MWQKDKTNLTLTFIWNEFETYCKLHSNELQAQYKLFKQLSQGTTPCDDWYTTVQNQLTMCNYKAETESVLQREIFLFGLNDQTFISKIISEESPDVTAATIRQKLKKLEAGRATAKYIRGSKYYRQRSYCRRCQPSLKTRQRKRQRPKEERLA